MLLEPGWPAKVVGQRGGMIYHVRGGSSREARAAGIVRQPAYDPV